MSTSSGDPMLTSGCVVLLGCWCDDEFLGCWCDDVNEFAEESFPHSEFFRFRR